MKISKGVKHVESVKVDSPSGPRVTAASTSQGCHNHVNFQNKCVVLHQTIDTTHTYHMHFDERC